jgi:transposase
MNMHKNARLTPHGRERIVRQVLSGQTPEAVALAAGVCPRTVRKWVVRFKTEGLEGLEDRSSRPRRLYRPTPQAIVEKVEALRRRRWTGKQIAAEVGVSPATVSRLLKRLGLNRIAALEPAEPVRRYERQHPGELIHIDINKLGRFERVGHRITGDRQSKSRAVGWEYVHVCIDDASRVAFSQILPDQKGSAAAFLKAAVAYYASLGVTVAGHDRQRLLLQSARLRQGLSRSRPQAHHDQALYSQDQWQGRALHPDGAARVGLCSGIPDF